MEDVKDREGGERLQDGFGVSSLPPLVSSLPSLPSLTQVYRARLQDEKPVRHTSRPTKGPHSSAEAPDDVPASEAAEMLLQAEALLLERRDRQRQVHRMQLQDAIGRLDELVLIPP